MTNEEAFDAARLKRREAKAKCIEAKLKDKEAFEKMNAARGQERQQLEKVHIDMQSAAAKADDVLHHAIRDETQALDREQRGM